MREELKKSVVERGAKEKKRKEKHCKT